MQSLISVECSTIKASINFSVVLTGQNPTIIPHVSHCSPVQYLRIGEAGTIQCNFQDRIGIIWFQNGEEGPVAYIQESRKGGSGYDRNELDIAANGSLIISNVTAKHEGTFHVATVISETNSEQETIQTIVIGKILFDSLYDSNHLLPCVRLMHDLYVYGIKCWEMLRSKYNIYSLFWRIFVLKILFRNLSATRRTTS